MKQGDVPVRELRGRTFEVNYDSRKREFELITQWPYDNGMQLPAAPLIPEPDDEVCAVEHPHAGELLPEAAEAEF